ncbi:MAG TPA: NAD-binding protein [Gemmataceae bacterium]|nr:NAD-binding protein [Gemmataceae bacterium]
MDQPIILCGLGRVGRRVLEYLRSAGLTAVVIDTDCTADDPRLLGCRLIKGDCRRHDILVQAGLEQARGVLILTSDDLVNIAAALSIRQLHPEIRIVMRMFNPNLIARLGQTVHNVYGLSTSNLTAPLIALTAMTGQALGVFHVEGLEEKRRQVAEVVIDSASPLFDKSLGHVVRGGSLVVAYFPKGGKDQWLHEVDFDKRLAAGDRLVLCGEPKNLGPYLAEMGENSTNVRWAGWLRRQGRALRRVFTEIDKPVKICAAILFSVILISSLIFHLGVQKDGLADAFFRTISIMATGGDMHGDDLNPTPGLKVFAAILRVSGAAITAAFTAIMANYLLRARLGGALEVRRIPDSGHIVVCGLGSVGFRVIEELLNQGERVVAIEIAANNRFVATARRLGAAVIIGDATVPEVHRQAHSGTARAVVAGTNEEIINLEIALLVRSINPLQRVVLRLSDADLAKMLRESANVRLAVSVSTLAAPAFVAALFGDRVLSVFLLQGKLLAAIDLIIGEQDGVFVDQTVRAVAVDYRLLPVAVLTSDGKVVDQPLKARLGKGDRLVGLIALPDMQRLVRREAAIRDCEVEVTSFPLPAKDWLATLVRTRLGVSSEEAMEKLAHLPFHLGLGMSRGEAEDVIAHLAREKISARLITKAI